MPVVDGRMKLILIDLRHYFPRYGIKLAKDEEYRRRYLSILTSVDGSYQTGVEDRKYPRAGAGIISIAILDRVPFRNYIIIQSE